MTIIPRQDLEAVLAAPEAPISCVPDLVDARAMEHPEALAVTALGDSLTYAELTRRAECVAARLRSLGVGRDVVVGLYLPRSLDMVVGALGVLKAGGAYLPLDPEYPLDRLAFMLDDARAAAVLTSRGSGLKLPKSTCAVVDMDGLHADADLPATPWSPTTQRAPVDPGDLAYIIYTSGSTGQPKGVEVTHASLANLVFWHQQAFAITADDRASHVAGLGFDASVWELWPYLTAGASVHLADEQTRHSTELLRDWMVAEAITIGFVPTPLAERLIADTRTWPSTTALRAMLTGGDVLQRFPAVGLPFTLVNNYGPTECTVVATSCVVRPEDSSATPPPIGRAIANARILILDEHLRPVPPGSPGEICVTGAGVARGYRNRPELTAERFIANPVDTSSATRLYRTGDLGQLLPDGQVAFLGRIDDQIKIRGYRIEPAEISSALNKHGDVSASVVVAREDVAGEKRLVAYVALVPDSNVGHSDLRNFLRERLPEYMLPAAFVRVERFPLTPNGKVDRARLPAPSAANTLQDDVATGVGTETEGRIADIVGELLKLEEIDLDDNFFMLGGHSLLGAQLIARLRSEFDVQIPLRTLFEAPTVALLAAEVDEIIARGDSASAAEPSCVETR